MGKFYSKNIVNFYFLEFLGENVFICVDILMINILIDSCLTTYERMFLLSLGLLKLYSEKSNS